MNDTHETHTRKANQMITAKQLFDAFVELGHTPESFTEPDFDVDGEIRFRSTAHVQIGFGYANVVHETFDGAFVFKPMIETGNRKAKTIAKQLLKQF